MFFLFLLMITLQPTHLSKSQNTSKIEHTSQSFVPFLSKSPRFRPTKVKQFINNPLELLHESSIHKSLPKAKGSPKPAHYFRSEIPRLPQPNITLTPSPTHYLIQQCSKSKEKTQPPQLQQIKLPHIQTIPTIPDSRNKFGYLYIDKYFALAEKSEEQVNLQKRLMKEYQTTLTEQQRSRQSYQKEDQCDVKSIQKKISKILGNQRRQKQNEQLIGKSKSSFNLKPKYLHLYNYREPEITKPPTQIQIQHIKHSSKTKFQFFNSSEQRFKLPASEEIGSKRPGVRDYLLRLQRH